MGRPLTEWPTTVSEAAVSPARARRSTGRRLRTRDSDVHVVVVVPEDAHDPRRAPQVGVRSDEDPHRARRDKSVEEVLRQPPVDLAGSNRRARATVEPRVVDVAGEPGLVAPGLGPDVGPARAGAGAGPYPRRLRVAGR